MSDNVAPQNLDAEESVLGSILFNKDAITVAAEHVRRQDFYRESHGLIFDAALDLDAKGENIDPISVAAELERRGQLEQIGGKYRIHELSSLAPASHSTKRHAQIIREMATRRSLVRAGAEISELGWEGIGEPGDLLASAEAALSGVSDGVAETDFATLGDDARLLTDDILKAAEEGKERYGVKTGFPTLDRKLTGLHPGRLYVLAARPSVGKSALAQNIATNIAARDIGVLFFSLEMSRDELALRQLSRITSIDTNRLALAKIDVHEQAALRAAEQRLAKLPFYVEDNGALRMPELRARVRRNVRKHPDTGLLVVDYLQLMLGSEDPESRQQEVALISRGLKLLAKELHIPVLALSQLNRGVEQRENKRPLLSDLRDSGAIEQDADVVMFLYREGLYKPVAAENENDTELLIRKNRMGEPGEVKLTFIKRREMYGEPAKGAEAA